MAIAEETTMDVPELAESEMKQEEIEQVQFENRIAQHEQIGELQLGQLSERLKQEIKQESVDEKFQQKRLRKRRPARIKLLTYSPEIEVYVNKKLVEAVGKFKVFLVNGEFIRSNLEPDFTMGSHHFVSDYIPEGEIWIDDRLSDKDRLSLIHHEIHETKLMKKGLSYEEAHASATRSEMRFRRKKFKNGYKDLPLVLFCSANAVNAHNTKC